MATEPSAERNGEKAPTPNFEENDMKVDMEKEMNIISLQSIPENVSQSRLPPIDVNEVPPNDEEEEAAPPNPKEKYPIFFKNQGLVVLPFVNLYKSLSCLSSKRVLTRKRIHCCLSFLDYRTRHLLFESYVSQGQDFFT